ncbi:MAG: cupin domain-containing protein [Deltaproteobacteria bacterium]|nr:cupin domain-containing protein [Deltaproteobacteria bacterium]
MAEKEQGKERLRQEEMDARLYYDYEGIIIKERLEREQMYLLPRVVKPVMFAKSGHALGDLRVFERYTVGPLGSLTCSFLEVESGGRTEQQRMIPAIVAYILEGSGESVQDGKGYPFSAEDVVVIPPYTTHHFVAGPEGGFRAWLPQVRLWHLLGLLWQEQFQFRSVPEGTEPIRDSAGQVVGFRVPQGVLGLKRDLEVRVGADPRREAFFNARRSAREARDGTTKFHYFLRRLAEENDMEKRAPRVIRGAEQPWEKTRQGQLKFYISYWSEVAARALDLVVQEIEPGGHSGRHRHIFEELLLVVEGNGHDMQEDKRYAWEAGDLICVPPMTTHQHFNDGKEAARLVSVWPRQLFHEFLGGIEHINDASGWRE